MTAIIDHPDFFLLDQDLSPEDIELRDKVRAFGQKEILPTINEYWERAEHPEPVFAKLPELGIIGSFIPGYGCPGFSRVRLRALWLASSAVSTARSTRSWACTPICAWAASTCSVTRNSETAGSRSWPSSRRRAPLP